MLFDSHCHLNFSVFAEEYHSILADCLAKDIGVINIGANIKSSRRAIEIAKEYVDQPVYASVGVHPSDVIKNKFNKEDLRKLITDKVVGIGETGLDYFHTPENKKTKKHKNIKTQDDWKEKQKQGFVQQLKFAQENNLPVILHARGSKENPQDAYLDILEILKTQIIRLSDYQITGVIHCFGSTQEIARQFLDLGFCIGFTGVITFKNKSVDELRQVVKYVPLEKILIETDAPYLAPEPHRGKENKPQYVEYVARKVAEIKGISYDEVCRMTMRNVKKLFKI